MLPLSALERAGSEIANYRGSGMSVIESPLKGLFADF